MLKRMMLVVLGLLAIPTLVLAQEGPPAPPDWVEIGSGVIAALTPFVSAVAVWLFKLAWSKIPAAYMFPAAAISGFLLNTGLNWLVNSTPATWWAGALMGLGAVVVRELLTTVKEKGLNGPVSVTTKML